MPLRAGRSRRTLVRQAPGQVEELSGSRRRGLGQPFHRFAASPRNSRRNMGQIGRLIPARFRLAGQVTRQKIRPIGLEQQPIRWNLAHERQQVRAAPLVADPPGDADRQIQFQAGCELLARAGKAMGDPAHERRAVLFQNSYKIRVCIALVQKNRLTDARSELQLAMKRLLLHSARRKVAKVIESTLADRDHLHERCKLAQLRQQLLSELFGVVRMYARGREEPPGMGTGHFDSLAGARTARASDDHLHYASGHRARNDRLTIGIEAVVSEIDTDIYQGTGYHV